MISGRSIPLLFALSVAMLSGQSAFAQYSADKVKSGISAAMAANASSNLKDLIDRSEKLAAGEAQGLKKSDVSAEWRLGYCFESWFIMTVQYRSLKANLAPDQAEACANSITTFGQKFRKAQKDLGLNDDQLFEALGKSPTVAENYSDYWPSVPN